MTEPLPSDRRSQTAAAQRLQLDVSRPDRQGRVVVAISWDGKTLFKDTCNPNSRRSRDHLVNEAAKKIPAIGEPAIAQQLDSTIMERSRCSADDSIGDAASGGRPSAEMLIDHALANGLELFHHESEGSDEPFMSRVVRGHLETYRIGGRSSRTALSQIAWEAFHSVVTEQVMSDVLANLAMQARTGKKQRPVGVRVLSHEGRTYLDLANSDWEVVEISTEGWTVKPADEVPVRFVRPPGLRELPCPERGGELEDLRPFLNLPGEDEWLLLRCWMTAALRTGLSYAVLIVIGEAGSAKSTFCDAIKSLLDPNACNLRVKPRNKEDLFSAAMHSHVQCYENLSGLPIELSDSFCVIATGGAVAKRKLYTDNEEAFARAQNPVLLNGIENPATQSDLADRSLVFGLPPISDGHRMPEEEFHAKFDAALPVFLGALLDLTVRIMQELEHLGPQQLTRMADFCRWGIATERALELPPGTFMAAYRRNRDSSHSETILASSIGTMLIRLLERDHVWAGTASRLLADLSALDPDASSGARHDFPKSPAALSNKLSRLAPSLRAIGIEFSQDRGSGRKRERVITLDATKWLPVVGPADASDDADDDSRSSGVEGSTPPPVGGSAGADRTRPAGGGGQPASDKHCRSSSEASASSDAGAPEGLVEPEEPTVGRRDASPAGETPSFAEEVFRRFGGTDGAIERINERDLDDSADLFAPLKGSEDPSSDSSNGITEARHG